MLVGQKGKREATHISPGQREVQVIFCTDIPSQKAPPLRGAGLVQVRERFCHPLPQRTLQADHSVQEDQPPFTEREKWGGEKERREVFTDCLLCASHCAGCCEFGIKGPRDPADPTVRSIMRQQWGSARLYPSVYSSDRRGTQRVSSVGNYEKREEVISIISKALEKPEYRRKISAFEFLLL